MTTGEGTVANHLRLEYLPEDQPNGFLPPGLHVDVGTQVTYLGPKQSVALPISLWGDNIAAGTGRIVLRVKSDETGQGDWGTAVVNIIFSEAKPALYFTPNRIETGVAYGESVAETVTLENKGLGDLNDVRLTLVKQDGTPAPSWVSLNSEANQGTIKVGDKKPVGVTFRPTLSSAPEGIYAFYLRVESSNHPNVDIGLYASVTQSGIGNVLFKVSDIYTGTIDTNNNLVQGLANAKIWLQNEAVLTVEKTKYTDSLGEVFLTDLPAGTYKYKITANNHQEKTGRLWIKPGVTTAQDVFLDYTLVTVEWSVKEITIKDKYEITLTATYETNVPAPVVVATPSSLTLPEGMRAGDVFNGEFTLTNHGLVRADNVSFSLPPSDQFFRYEMLVGLPDSLAAKEVFVIPYRVTSLKTPSLTDSDADSGGGCATYRTCVWIYYDYCCANGDKAGGSTQYCWLWSYGSCGGGGGGGSGGVPIYYGGGSGVGSYAVGGYSTVWSQPAPMPQPITGAKCLPTAERPAPAPDPCQKQETSEKTRSSADMLLRQYTDDHTDLSVKALGYTIDVTRRFYDDAWHFDHASQNLELDFGYDGKPKTIVKDGAQYTKANSTGTIFALKNEWKIYVTPTGYRWLDKKGNWSEHDSAGRVLTSANRNNVKLFYDYDGNGRLQGVKDNNGVQVLWYSYNAAGLLTSVRDAQFRSVGYTYDDSGRLTKVADVRNFETARQGRHPRSSRRT